MHSPAQCQPGQPQLLLCGHEWEEFGHQDLKGGVGPRLKGDLSQAASSGPPKEGLGSGEVPGHTWGHHAPAPSSSKSFQFSPVAPGPGHCWHVHRPRRSYYPGVGEERRQAFEPSGSSRPQVLSTANTPLAPSHRLSNPYSGNTFSRWICWSSMATRSLRAARVCSSWVLE